MIVLLDNISKYALGRYIVSGTAAAVVHLGLLYLLTEFAELWYLLSAAMALIVAFFVSFTLQKFWTFRNSKTQGTKKQLLFYFFVAVGMVSLNTVFMYVLVDIVGLWYLFAQVPSIAVLAFLSFILYGRVVFNKTDATKDNTGIDTRVLIATGLYPPDIGGPATYSRLIEEEFPKRNISIEVLSFGYVRHFPRLIRHFFYFFEVLQRGTHVDVIVALDPVSVGLPAIVAAKLLKKKFVLKVGGDYAWEQFQNKNAKRKTQKNTFITPMEFQDKRFDFLTEVQRKIEHFVARNARMVIVPSEYLKGIVVQWGIEQKKIEVIYNSFVIPSYLTYLADHSKINRKIAFI